MRKRVQERGEYDWSAEDLIELQSQPFELIDATFNQFGDVVISGCVVTGSDISGGVVALDGVIMPFGGASNVLLPCYLVAQRTIIEGRYVDGLDKPISYDYKAIIVTEHPEDESFIVIASDGAEKLLKISSDAIDSDTSNTIASSKAVATLNKKVLALSPQKEGLYINDKTIETGVFGEDLEIGDIVNNSLTLFDETLSSIEYEPFSSIFCDANNVAFSADGVYFAKFTERKYEIFKRNIQYDFFTSLPAYNGPRISFSPNGDYCAVVDNGDVRIYQMVGDDFIQISNIPSAHYAEFAPNGKYLFVRRSDHTNQRGYKIENDKFIDCATLKDGDIFCCFTPNSNIVVIKSDSQSTITFYEITSTGFVKSSDVIVENASTRIVFSPDGSYFACAGSGDSSFIQIYKKNGNSYTKLLQIDTPIAITDNFKFSYDSRVFIVSCARGGVWDRHWAFDTYFIRNDVFALESNHLPISSVEVLIEQFYITSNGDYFMLLMNKTIAILRNKNTHQAFIRSTAFPNNPLGKFGVVMENGVKGSCKKIKILLGSNEHGNNYSANGYYRLHGGLILQWGWLGIIKRNTAYFPIAFHVSCFFIVTGSGDASIQITDRTKFSVSHSGSELFNADLFWFAIGM